MKDRPNTCLLQIIRNAISREKVIHNREQVGAHSPYNLFDEFSVTNIYGNMGGLEDNHKEQGQQR